MPISGPFGSLPTVALGPFGGFWGVRRALTEGWQLSYGKSTSPLTEEVVTIMKQSPIAKRCIHLYIYIYVYLYMYIVRHTRVYIFIYIYRFECLLRLNRRGEAGAPARTEASVGASVVTNIAIPDS